MDTGGSYIIHPDGRRERVEEPTAAHPQGNRPRAPDGTLIGDAGLQAGGAAIATVTRPRRPRGRPTSKRLAEAVAGALPPPAEPQAPAPASTPQET